MEPLSFNNLLFRTAFCCMACDGDIDAKEVTLLKTMCEKLPFLKDIDFKTESNILIEQINERGTDLLVEYLDSLKSTSLSEEEEITLIDYAIKMIKADEIIKYSEIKFFKNIRYRLKVSDEKLWERFSEEEYIERFLEKEIETQSLLDKITSQYLDIAKLPKFELISFDANLLETKL